MATRIRFNRTTLVEVDGARYWTKGRLACSSMLVVMANAYAKATGLPMRMLAEGPWLDYESRAVEELLGWGVPLRKGKQLLLPLARGEPLRNILANSSAAQKQEALELATRELARLHHRWIHHPLAGCMQSFSHADATPGNVVVDLDRRAATWLDFETVHPPGMPAHCRHADDLRTLLCGLTPILSADELPAMTRAVLAVYQEANVLAALRETFCYWNRRPRARLLAMPATGETQWRCLLEAVCR